MTTVSEIRDWHTAIRSVPTDKDFSVQLGCHIEEFVEMLNTLEVGVLNASVMHLCWRLNDLATQFKQGFPVKPANRIEFLDSLADQIVTAVGAGHCARMDIAEAVYRVNESNWSKFDDDGLPNRDANGKIIKGPNYRPPVLDDLC